MRVLHAGNQPAAAHFCCAASCRRCVDFAVAGVRVPGDCLGIRCATAGHGAADRLPALLLLALMLKCLGLLLSMPFVSWKTCQGDEFRDLPAVFLPSSALYPLWKMARLQ